MPAQEENWRRDAAYGAAPCPPAGGGRLDGPDFDRRAGGPAVRRAGRERVVARGAQLCAAAAAAAAAHAGGGLCGGLCGGAEEDVGGDGAQAAARDLPMCVCVYVCVCARAIPSPHLLPIVRVMSPPPSNKGG